jgi:hypothetical protein
MVSKEENDCSPEVGSGHAAGGNAAPLIVAGRIQRACQRKKSARLRIRLLGEDFVLLSVQGGGRLGLVDYIARIADTS